MKPLRPHREVVSDWAEELAAKLGRPAILIASAGLSADDFSIASSVEVRSTGVVFRFSFAFAVIRPAEKRAAVFSEHGGYVEFDLREDDVVAEIHEEIYRQE